MEVNHNKSVKVPKQKKFQRYCLQNKQGLLEILEKVKEAENVLCTFEGDNSDESKIDHEYSDTFVYFWRDFSLYFESFSKRISDIITKIDMAFISNNDNPKPQKNRQGIEKKILEDTIALKL